MAHSNDPFMEAGFRRLNEIGIEVDKLRKEETEIRSNLRAICHHPWVLCDWEYWSEPGEYGNCGYKPRRKCSLCGLIESGWTYNKLEDDSQRTVAPMPPMPKW